MAIALDEQIAKLIIQTNFFSRLLFIDIQSPRLKLDGSFSRKSLKKVVLKNYFEGYF